MTDPFELYPSDKAKMKNNINGSISMAQLKNILEKHLIESEDQKTRDLLEEIFIQAKEVSDVYRS